MKTKLIYSTFKANRVNLRLAIGLILFTVLVISCKYEDGIVSVQKNKGLLFDDLKTLYVDREDRENQEISEIILLTALSFHEVMQDLEVRNYILNELEKDINSEGTSLVDLSQNNNLFGEQLATELQLHLVNQDLPDHLKPLLDIPKEDIIKNLEAMMVYQNESYLLSVYLNKFDNHTAIEPRGVGYITAVASDITDNDYDQIMAEMDSDSFLLSEAYAGATTETIVFVGTGAREQINFTDPGDNKPKIMPRDNEVDVDVDSWRIQSGHRYDSDKYSEVCMYYIQFDDDGDEVERYFAQGFNPKKVHKNDIDNIAGGTLFQTDVNYFDVNIEDYLAGNNVHLGAFEYDWYASKKNLTPTCSDNPQPTAPTFQARMKFSNEWYFFSCRNIVTQWHGFHGGMHTDFPVSNPKCDMFFYQTTE